MKIAICIPHYGDVKAKFAVALGNMVAATMTGPHYVGVYGQRGPRLIENRRKLVETAKKDGAEAILWADADHVFPPDSLLRLIAHDKLVVGCNYAQRGKPTCPTASRLSPRGGFERIWTTPDQAGQLEKVTFLGLGFCLVRMEALAGIKGSLFQAPLGRDGEVSMPEDAFFFHRLREAGHDIFLDHGLSWEIIHLFEDELRLSDALEQRKAASLKNPAGEGLGYVRSNLSSAGLK